MLCFIVQYKKIFQQADSLVSHNHFRFLSGRLWYRGGMLRTLSRILFPSPCLYCGLLGEPLCSRCFEELRFEPHRRELEGLSVVSPYFYLEKSLLADLIYPFKYSHQSDIFRIFVPGLKEALRLLRVDLEGLVFAPVPLHPSRFLERGYNQAELLAKAVAKGMDGRVWNGLVRVKDTGFQSHVKKREERKENMKGAFEVVREWPGTGQIILVDDIVTSGSTLLACAEALRAAGVKNCSALTLADREKKAKNFGD